MISNYKEFLNFLNTLKTKPRLLLHSCCGPCSSHCLIFLLKYFDITIYYYNPNIYPEEEYLLRLENQKKIVDAVNKEYNENIKIMVEEYNEIEFLNEIKGYEDCPERGNRCYKCYEFRLKKTFLIKEKYNFDFFTTTLSISPHKNSIWINEIGSKYQGFLYSDFKKQEGYKNSILYSKKYNLYRQEYCGCRFSKNWYDKIRNNN